MAWIRDWVVCLSVSFASNVASVNGIKSRFPGAFHFRLAATSGFAAIFHSSCGTFDLHLSADFHPNQKVDILLSPQK